jgi:hypothetical protein
MNGTTTSNAQVAARDPTAQPDGSYVETGAGLRDRTRFCLWCQELVTLRILQRTDQLNGPTTRRLVAKGNAGRNGRRAAEPLLDAPRRLAAIVAAEAAYAAMTRARGDGWTARTCWPIGRMRRRALERPADGQVAGAAGVRGRRLVDQNSTSWNQ